MCFVRIADWGQGDLCRLCCFFASCTCEGWNHVARQGCVLPADDLTEELPLARRGALERGAAVWRGERMAGGRGYGLACW